MASFLSYQEENWDWKCVWLVTWILETIEANLDTDYWDSEGDSFQGEDQMTSQ